MRQRTFWAIIFFSWTLSWIRNIRSFGHSRYSSVRSFVYSYSSWLMCKYDVHQVIQSDCTWTGEKNKLSNNLFEGSSHWRIFHSCGYLKAANLLPTRLVYSALMAIEYCGFFSVPQLLWHGTSVYMVICGAVTTCYDDWYEVCRDWDSSNQHSACETNFPTSPTPRLE